VEDFCERKRLEKSVKVTLWTKVERRAWSGQWKWKNLALEDMLERRYLEEVD
jgi:hypothetical protein